MLLKLMKDLFCLKFTVVTNLCEIENYKVPIKLIYQQM